MLRSCSNGTLGKYKMDKLIKKIQNFAGQYNLWKENSKIIVGVSGGPDSVCLLDILVKLAPKYNFKLHIAHVNYHLRGKDSDGDEKFVRKLAGKYGLKIDVLDIGTSLLNSTLGEERKSENTSSSFLKGGNLENKLREIRYDFFEKIKRRKKYNSVAVGHNQDDQAETVLMRVLRGAGLQGLKAMRPKDAPLQRGGEKFFLIRPLLNTSRKEILEYLKKNKLKYQTDITNKDTKIFRNKIRHKLIPYLEKNYNSNIKKNLADTASIIADDYDFLSAHTERILKQMNAHVNKKSKITFSAERFLKLHPAIQRQYLRQIICKIKLDLIDIEYSHIEEIIKTIKSSKNKIQELKFKGLKLRKKGDKVIIITNSF